MKLALLTGLHIQTLCGLGAPKNVQMFFYSNDLVITGNTVWEFDTSKRYLDNDCFRSLYTLRVIGIVPYLVDAANQNFLVNKDPTYKRSGSDAEVCLIQREGICGSHTAVAMKLFELVDIPARTVEFYFSYGGKRRNHIGVEVFLDGDFRYVDPTYSAYWVPRDKAVLEFATTSEVLSGHYVSFRYNRLIYPYGYDDLFSREGFFSFINEGMSVVRGGKGEILLSQNDSKTNIDNLNSVKNYVGDNLKDGNLRPVSFKLVPNDNLSSIKVTVRFGAIVLGSEKLETSVCVGDECFPLRENHAFQFDVQGPSVLRLIGDVDGVYGIIEYIGWGLGDSE